MPDNRRTNKILKKTDKSNKLQSAEDLICIPRPLFEQMEAIIRGLANNGGRSKNLLAELAEVKTTK